MPGVCKGGSVSRPFSCRTLDRKRSTDERSSVACRDRSRAELSTMSAERLVVSLAAAVPAMPRATLAVPSAA